MHISKLSEIITEILSGCRPYILPERYMLPFSEAAENEGLRPSAILLVTMMQAVNVPKMDIFSASDPYCRQGLSVYPFLLPAWLLHSDSSDDSHITWMEYMLLGVLILSSEKQPDRVQDKLQDDGAFALLYQTQKGKSG